jgi:hypothetical protein
VRPARIRDGAEVLVVGAVVFVVAGARGSGARVLLVACSPRIVDVVAGVPDARREELD